VRLKPDPQGLTLVEKLGGWAKFYATQITSVVRAIWGWEDTNANKWIAYGTSNTQSTSLVAITCLTNGSGITTASTNANNIYDITPKVSSGYTRVNFVADPSGFIIIKNNSTSPPAGVTQIYVSTPVSVGGLVIFGLYNIYSITAFDIYIYALDKLDNIIYPKYTTLTSPLAITGGSSSVSGNLASITFTFALQTSPPFLVGEGVSYTGINPVGWNGCGIVQSCTVTSVIINAYQSTPGAYVSGGSLSNSGLTPVFVPIDNSVIVMVILADHGYNVGDTFSIPNEVSVGGNSVYGNYIVTQVPNYWSFYINTEYVFGTSGSPNIFTAHGGSNIIIGGSSTTSVVTLNIGLSLSRPSVPVSGGSSTTSAVTLLVPSDINFTYGAGATITVSGIVSPATWNGTYTVISTTSGSVTYALSGSALSWGSGGSIEIEVVPYVGSFITVNGVYPTSWNGSFVVSSATTTTISYALSGSALSWVSGGSVSFVGGNATFVYSAQNVVSSGYVNQGAVSSNINATNWVLDNWGEVLLACPLGYAPTSVSGTNVNYGPIYAWDPISSAMQIAPITNCPILSTGFFVAMPQRQVIAWGTTFSGIIDPLLIRWCDVSNYNVWVAQTTNQAGSYRLSTGSAIIGAIQAQQQGLLWTDIGLWSMQYIGTPYVYSFNQLGQGCGLIARRAMGILGGIVYWMGRSQFFTLSGDGVTPLLCPIWDVVFQNLDLANLSKITCAPNSLFNEVTWYYPVIGGNGENAAYIRVNTVLNAWEFGTLGRTAWIDNSVLGPPIGYDPANQYIYQHEISPDADGAAMVSSFTTGYFAIAEGDQKAFLDQVWPDFKWGYYSQSQLASISITFNACDYPGQTPTTYGPFTVTQASTWFSPRIRARLISITVSSSDAGTWWRMGALRYRVCADGKF
jgi:hypothetical protein